MVKSTMYITIPKERAAGILTEKHSKYFVYDDDGGEIVISKSTFGSRSHIATLEDYKIPDARIESGNGSLESGTVGTRVQYSDSKVRELLEDYEI